jgi:hypothetical protein
LTTPAPRSLRPTVRNAGLAEAVTTLAAVCVSTWSAGSTILKPLSVTTANGPPVRAARARCFSCRLIPWASFALARRKSVSNLRCLRAANRSRNSEAFFSRAFKRASFFAALSCAALRRTSSFSWRRRRAASLRSARSRSFALRRSHWSTLSVVSSLVLLLLLRLLFCSYRKYIVMIVRRQATRTMCVCVDRIERCSLCRASQQSRHATGTRLNE